MYGYESIRQIDGWIAKPLEGVQGKISEFWICGQSDCKKSDK